MFYGGLSESTENGKEVPINDTQPKIFWVLLLCLYGESLENATNFVFGDFTNQESQKTFYLDLLKATDYYGGVVDLISEIEDIIINNYYIGVTNVYEILEWSKDSNATRLRDCCKECIGSNRGLIVRSGAEDINILLKNMQCSSIRTRVKANQIAASYVLYFFKTLITFILSLRCIR